ncbi:Ryanodine receptor 3 [Phytophthora boehmeriae]|uniref:Ryanodine receptor 3 n=1 Tax=Phytophthora boehmeriae TaxID=109152 RepID=A0A8T1WSR8_9STRA|nr:Ryanodine receptor 3 [Phytophthora boehmeriae]
MQSNRHAETLEAFYDRVMHRVCEAYREEAEAQDPKAADLLDQTWKEKLMRYTGRRSGPGTVNSNNISVAGTPEDAASSGDEVEQGGDASSFVSTTHSSPVAAIAAPRIGRPIAQLPSDAVSSSSSVFAKMV